MSTRPVYPGAPWIGIGSISAANTNRDGSGTIADIGSTAPTAGRLVSSCEFKSTGQPADSVLTLFVHDGSTWTLRYEIDLGAPAAGSTTVAAFWTRLTFDDLWLPSGYKLGGAITVTPTSGVIKALAYGRELT